MPNLENEFHSKLDVSWTPGTGNFTVPRVECITATGAAKSRAAIPIGRTIATGIDPSPLRMVE
jgi:hypothetical protein